jgi:hypothetical protein
VAALQVVNNPTAFVTNNKDRAVEVIVAILLIIVIKFDEGWTDDCVVDDDGSDCSDMIIAGTGSTSSTSVLSRKDSREECDDRHPKREANKADMIRTLRC